MARENLDDALELMFGHEGGYANSKSDAGGPTKYGITHKTLAAHRGVKSVTVAQVKALTIEEAEDIYRKSYWGQSGGDALPAGLDYAAFDFGVNSGPVTAVKKLQEVLAGAGVYSGAIDGWVGPGTLAGVRTFPGGLEALIVAYCERRMAYLRSLKSKKTGFPANGRGWTIRVTGKDPLGQYRDEPGVIGNALALARRRPVTPPKPATRPVEIDEAAGAKAEPKAPNPWTSPEVLLPAGGTVATGAGTLFAGADPIRIALAVAIMVAVGLGAYFAFRHIRKAAA